MEKGHRDFECLNPFDTHDHSHFFLWNKRRHGSGAALLRQDPGDWNPVGWRTEWDGLEGDIAPVGARQLIVATVHDAAHRIIQNPAACTVPCFSHAQGTWALWTADSTMPPWFSERRWTSIPGRILTTRAWRHAVTMKRLINFCHCCLGREGDALLHGIYFWNFESVTLHCLLMIINTIYLV